MKGEKYIKLNSNTQIITRKSDSSNKALSYAPAKVTNRLELNINRLNRLATTIVTPGLVEGLNRTDLERVLRFSNEANCDICLPETNNIFIRTAGRSGQKTEPSLLVQDVSGEMRCTYSGLDGTRKIENLEEFTRKIVRPGTFLIIHDDNYKLQKQGIHSRTLETPIGAELLYGTDVLHTRYLEDENKPTVRVNVKSKNILSHFRMSKLFIFEPEEVGDTAESQSGYTEKGNVGLRVKNMCRDTAERIAKEIKKTEEALLGAHEVGQELRGNNVVVESRIYTTLSGGIGRRLQVIDID